MRTYFDWKPFLTVAIFLMLILTPRFGQAGDPEAGLLADTQGPEDARPQLTVRVMPEAGGEEDELRAAPADEWSRRLAEELDALGVVDTEQGPIATSGAAALRPAYRVEVGLRAGSDDGELLRVQVLARDGQVLLGFRVPTGAGADRSVEQASDRLGAWFAQREWSSSVASVEGRRVLIFGGSRHRLKPGLALQAVAHRPVYDDEGHQLGHASAPVAALRVVSVDEAMATAEILSGDGDVKPGTEVVLER